MELDSSLQITSPTLVFDGARTNFPSSPSARTQQVEGEIVLTIWERSLSMLLRKI